MPWANQNKRTRGFAPCSFFQNLFFFVRLLDPLPSLGGRGGVAGTSPDMLDLITLVSAVGLQQVRAARAWAWVVSFFSF